MFNRKIIEYLVKWKNKKGRKPLILRGARQVGKTSAVLMFAKGNFKDTVYINLEDINHLKLFKGQISLEDFLNIIKIKFRQKIEPNKTLIFIDEIQNAPSLMKLLRFFYEAMPYVHVIASGSLLEVTTGKEGFSFPVGRVEFAYMYPLDFFEFLGAKKETELLEFLKTVQIEGNIPAGIHEEAMKQFYEYVMIGGMPEIVQTYIDNNEITCLLPLYSALFKGYCEDVYKYSSLAKAKYLSYVIETSPLYAGISTSYEKFGGANFKSREMQDAFSTLEKTMVVKQVLATKSAELPLIPQPKRAKKILFLDVGLVNYQMGIHDSFWEMKELSDFYQGRIAEQIVGQNILAQFINTPPRIFYWARKKTEGIAEVDYCIVNRGKIVGIEIKSGTANNLKSLLSFSKLVKNNQLIRIYSGRLQRETIKVSGTYAQLISIPFYLTPRVLNKI